MVEHGCFSGIILASHPATASPFRVPPVAPDGKESACNAGHPGSIPEWGKSLEKDMATHSSIPAGRIPWTEQSGELQSMDSQRVGRD